MMELNDVQVLFDAGKLKEVILEPSFCGNGWLVEFKDESGHVIKLTTHNGEERIYSSLDAATKITEMIGFRSARIEERF